jgi:hypothetical protein
VVPPADHPYKARRNPRTTWTFKEKDVSTFARQWLAEQMEVSCAFPRALNLNGLNTGKKGNYNPSNPNKILDCTIPLLGPDELVSVPVWVGQNASHDPRRQKRHPLAVNPRAKEASSPASFHHLISVDFVDKMIQPESLFSWPTRVQNKGF